MERGSVDQANGNGGGDRNWYSVRETAEILRVSDKTVYRWLSDNRIPASEWFPVGGAKRIFKRFVDDVAQGRRSI